MNSFFENKKILITGHTGFKGGWLTLLLQSMGADVRGFSLKPATNSFFELTGMEDVVRGSYGDINDYGLIEAALREFSPDIVFHLAAQAIVSESHKDPIKTYATNVMGTVHLLEAVRKTPSVQVVVNVTTDKCYENKEWVWRYRENDPLGGGDPYSSSKSCSELIGVAYYRSYFNKSNIKLGTARSGNVVGGGDFGTDRLIPDFIRSIENNTTLTVRYPLAVRPWQHVLDCVYGYLLMAHHLWHKECSGVASYNFAPDSTTPVTVGDIIRYMSQCLEIKKEIQKENKESFQEHSYLTLDNSKAKKELQWSPSFNINEVMYQTAEWYKVYLNNKVDKGALLAVSLQQINRFRNGI